MSNRIFIIGVYTYLMGGAYNRHFDDYLYV